MDRKTLITHLKNYFHLNKTNSIENLNSEKHIELFSSDQIEQYGTNLALSYHITNKPLKDILLKRLTEYEANLLKCYNILNDSYESNNGFSPASEWFLDNFYLIQEQIQTVRRHLLQTNARLLPQLIYSIHGYPRIYDVTLQIIEHGDGRWDLENLTRFVTGYQKVNPFKLCELWAIPIMLGLALIENLSKVAKCIVADKNDRSLANSWADRMIEVTVAEPKNLITVIAEMSRSELSMSNAFIAELARRLQSAALSLPLSWLEQQLSDEGITLEESIQKANNNQAANQITVSNSIDSLRRLEITNWHVFVESISIVEQILRKDPIDIYSKMDFSTRNSYRQVIERLSQKTLRSEKTISEIVLQLATRNLKENAQERSCHVGYYLLDKGLIELEQTLGIRQTIWQKFRYFNQPFILQTYTASILMITAMVIFIFLHQAFREGVPFLWMFFLGFIVLIGGSQLAIETTNFIASLLVTPKPFPKMDCSKGILPEWRTLVVIPTMLSNFKAIEKLVEELEVRFLGNRDPYLHFMLLTDFNDAPCEHMPNDDILLNFAAEKIISLNKLYPGTEGNTFFLCHRSRTWNPAEKVWMGWERKRGKLSDLNNYLRDQSNVFSYVVGSKTILEKIQYVIILDTDTQLPRESARKLIGTIAHLLNHPLIDSKKKIVVEGYGILQPRIAEALLLTGSTRYMRLYGNDLGIDPYTRTISDIYQDLFHEGSFIGKGIYNVDVFSEVLKERFPDNLILSHDLLEGCYLHSGYVSDIPLFENSPGNYLIDIKRRSRWIRGDWQIVQWLLPWVYNSQNQRVRNPISTLSKIKIFDNLRRSLVPISLMILFGLTWVVLPHTGFWLTAVLSIIIFPSVLQTLLELARKPRDMLIKQHIFYCIQQFIRRLKQLLIYLACLPFEAWYTFVAILRTLWRLTITRQHLLEWVPSDQVTPDRKDSIKTWIITLWPGPVVALIAGGWLFTSKQLFSLLISVPLLLLWFISPWLMQWLSRPISMHSPKLSVKQRQFLRKLSRKTWGFFETFLTSDNHWLPPDNFQEIPIETLARRTSPTNIGLALLANLSAYDFGYITIPDLLERTHNTLQSILQLERYHGHLYNWYSTETLSPLLPRYISSVDSGNLLAHLVTLKRGLLELADDPVLNIQYLNGLEDTYLILSDLSPFHLTIPFNKILANSKKNFLNWKTASIACNEFCEASEKILILTTQSNPNGSESIDWANKLFLECCRLRDEINVFSSLQFLHATSSLREIANLNPNSKDDNLTILQAKKRLELIDSLIKHIDHLTQMDMHFLYNEDSHLLTIGYNVETQRKDDSSYDLLSSEARLGLFVAIAQGQILQESWFALGRLLVSNKNNPILISWSGSMFEYLMPLLVMPNYPSTLLDQTYSGVVNQHITYAKQYNIPWGMSESGYNSVDTQFNYLYRAFGVPTLGLKRGLEDEWVVAPYASAMALMVAPEEACRNLERLESEYAMGKYGFYEAIDYTKTRLKRDNTKAIVRSFMSHHQGMTLLALSYVLHHQPMQRRFTRDPSIQSGLLLLQERVPRPSASYFKMPQQQIGKIKVKRLETSMRVFTNANNRSPQVQLLSNGRYHVVLTQAGSGYSRWNNIALTRWRDDTTCDNWGMFCYLRDVSTGTFWSTCYQPTAGKIDKYKVIFTEGMAEFFRNDNNIDIHNEIVVSPEDDIELRRFRIHNKSKIKRTIEFTSFCEIVLNSQGADLAAPAFSNLFIETELLTQKQAILARRRGSDEGKSFPWLCHLLNLYTHFPYQISFETDRSKFIGRNRTVSSPLAFVKTGELSNTTGAVLDPVASIRCQFTLEPDGLVILDLLTGVAETRDQIISLVDKYQDRRFANRIFGLAWTHAQVLLHQLNITEAEAQLYCKIASSLIYANNGRRADPAILASNRLGQNKLWSFSISGDLPIVLLHIENSANITLVRQLIQAQVYWHRKGLEADLVILNEEQTSYRQPLQELISSLISANISTINDTRGRILVRSTDQITQEERILLESVAHIIISDQKGTLKEQLNRRRVGTREMPALEIKKRQGKSIYPSTISKENKLQFDNSLGGFSTERSEYVIYLREHETTPAPWINILANPHFGTLITESGQGYTWIENSHEFRLTPWNNDPLQDTSEEAFYIRDDYSGRVWSPTLLPCRGSGDYQIRHGFGYSVFEHTEDGIYSEMTIHVPVDAPIKFVIMKINNLSLQSRKLSVFGFIAWVLGDLRSKNKMHIVTELSSQGALLATNRYNTDFGERTAFFNVTTTKKEWKRFHTGDRTEFLGRNGSFNKPASLSRECLSGKVGAGLDPCGALQLTFELEKGETTFVIFTLGAAQNKQATEKLLQQYDSYIASQSTLKSVKESWSRLISTIQIKTPDPALDLLVNGWLLYQVLSSRLWGRTGYYQSSGAFGFRDQLQDVMALIHTAPELVRNQIILNSAHQFEEGDVQHWWHPPFNRGIRSRCSDDYLWLPYVLCYYIQKTGDQSILDEQIPFLKGRLLKPDEEAYYEAAETGTECFSLYEHAKRAIINGFKFGKHGLPLIGSGDWNDGMNWVGKEGRGESVWLGFFLYRVLQEFSLIAKENNDANFSIRCKEQAAILKEKLEEHGWDGEWYRRAYFDDGTPLGSASNSECRIDSIAQSWSVISGVASESRRKQAMNSLKKHLVDESNQLIKLLTPPFDRSTPSPGYIEDYVPGIRENGAQYTHAAAWAILAFAQLGETTTAWELLNLVNPINHGRNSNERERYKIEPYVTAGDVYSENPHQGRGGWSWYTGSAGWLYHVIIETLLGIQLKNGNQLSIQPLLPQEWSGFNVEYIFQNTLYKISVNRVKDNPGIVSDGENLIDPIILLENNGKTHEVKVNIL